jgi:hypothetical protein
MFKKPASKHTDFPFAESGAIGREIEGLPPGTDDANSMASKELTDSKGKNTLLQLKIVLEFWL